MEITEWESCSLELTEIQVAELRRHGELLNARNSHESDEIQESENQSAFNIQKLQDGSYKVLAENCIGAVDLDGQLLLIQPKIAFKHFARVMRHSMNLPDSANDEVGLDSFESFELLVVSWFVREVSRLIPQHLIRNYYPIQEQIPFVKGHVNILRTTRNFLGGNLKVDSEFDEFGMNHSLNRVLKSALLVAANLPTLSRELRIDVERCLSYLSNVDRATHQDLRVQLDRRSMRNFRSSLDLAKTIIGHQGRGLSNGSGVGRSFLLQTPLLVEEGIRNLLRKTFSQHKVDNQIRPTKSVGNAHPDLVFNDGKIVGDVKYKIVNSWSDNRADQYQSVFFAAAFKTKVSLITCFCNNADVSLPMAEVGENRLFAALWNTSISLTPVESERLFLEQVKICLNELEVSQN
jgi:5-methylcytosine-specific restriction endonuclease McrBC regulatory subunit McrC